MKKLQTVLIFLVLFTASCKRDEVIPKPKNLIKEQKMIEMLVDIHIAEATFNKFRYDDEGKKNTSANYYYSVLDKYHVPDSVFEKSYVYYASKPKNFEKMYRKVMNNLSQIEQEYSGRKEELEPLNFEGEIKKK